MTKKYFWQALMMAMLAAPLAAIVFGVFLATSYIWQRQWLIVAFSIIPVTTAWALFCWVSKKPASYPKRMVPPLIAFGWYMLAFIICMFAAGFDYEKLGRVTPFPWLSFPMQNAKLEMYPWMALLHLLIAAICLYFAPQPEKPLRPRLALAGGALGVLVLMGIALYEVDINRNTVIDVDYSQQRVKGEVALENYAPFSAWGEALTQPEAPPTLAIDSDYPVLDGATAGYPVYAAMAEAIYRGLDQDTADHYVRCTRTDGAYQSLIEGEADIIFCAQPSKAQLALAESKGVTLQLTPIAREAFVFIVNRDNPVDGLGVEQVRSIYTDKITNWQQLGGQRLRIVPFQRPADSGSQTTMEQLVMRGEPLSAPLEDNRIALMGGLVEGVVAYRDQAGAIGYSFRYFIEQMKPDERVKMLSIDGVAPSIPNIQSGAYPFSLPVYAVTAGTKNPNAQKLLNWIGSDEGQSFVEQCGYVRVDSP